MDAGENLNLGTPFYQGDAQIEQNLVQYFNHDLVLLPYFFDDLDQRATNDNHKHVFQKDEMSGQMEAICGCTNERRAVLVSVKVLDNQVDLFDVQERDNDNQDISNSVLDIMNLASSMQQIELNEDLIDGDTKNIEGVLSDEDMLVIMCYIAECFTFGKEPDLDTFDVNYQRKRIVDVFLGIVNLR